MKIVLDADVIIHFSKGSSLSILPSIFDDCDFIILDKVYDEVRTIQKQIDNQIKFLGNLKLEQFNPIGEIYKEYAILRQKFGSGESACMAYCKYTNNIIGSSNLRDIHQYCKSENITYLTTLDFLYYAWRKGIISKEDCHDFIEVVRSKGSKLPLINIDEYSPSCVL